MKDSNGINILLEYGVKPESIFAFVIAEDKIFGRIGNKTIFDQWWKLAQPSDESILNFVFVFCFF